MFMKVSTRLENTMKDIFMILSNMYDNVIYESAIHLLRRFCSFQRITCNALSYFFLIFLMLAFEIWCSD
jgi:hypothetical protein